MRANSAISAFYVPLSTTIYKQYKKIRYSLQTGAYDWVDQCAHIPAPHAERLSAVLARRISRTHSYNGVDSTWFAWEEVKRFTYPCTQTSRALETVRLFQEDLPALLMECLL